MGEQREERGQMGGNGMVLRRLCHTTCKSRIGMRIDRCACDLHWQMQPLRWCMPRAR
jgi:hypothetical protein